MNLMDELKEFDTVFSSMSVVEQSMRISPKQIQEMQGKQTRLQELHNSLGWSKPMVHNKLQEITWDTTAASRQSRHTAANILQPHSHSHAGKKSSARAGDQSVVSDAMKAHMMSVAEWAISGKPGRRCVLDVGCGTGLLCQFIKQVQVFKNLSTGPKDSTTTTSKNQKRSTSSSNPTASNANNSNPASGQAAQVIGVDISQEMVKIARTNYPDSIFVHADFLKFSLSQSPPSFFEQGPPVTEIDSIVFNEVLHNFLDIKAALYHAKALLLNGAQPSSLAEKRIIISNPKGQAGISKQHAMNRWLCPSLLPSEQELQAITEDLGMKVLLTPDKQSLHYLAVLSPLL